jgi:hypothetical protein
MGAGRFPSKRPWNAPLNRAQAGSFEKREGWGQPAVSVLFIGCNGLPLAVGGGSQSLQRSWCAPIPRPYSAMMRARSTALLGIVQRSVFTYRRSVRSARCLHLVRANNVRTNRGRRLIAVLTRHAGHGQREAQKGDADRLFHAVYHVRRCSLPCGQRSRNGTLVGVRASLAFDPRGPQGSGQGGPARAPTLPAKVPRPNLAWARIFLG